MVMSCGPTHLSLKALTHPAEGSQRVIDHNLNFEMCSKELSMPSNGTWMIWYEYKLL